MTPPQTIKQLKENWKTEGEAALLYQTLAGVEPDERRRGILQRLAQAELRHQSIFAEHLAKAEAPAGPFRPGLRTRMLAWLARHGGTETVLGLQIRKEVRLSAQQGSQSLSAEAAAADLGKLARDDAMHAHVLQGLSRGGAEPWHSARSGNFLKNVVYGFNDGLTANFGLVMGVLGAQVQASMVLLTGLAGLIADALSMGSSSYLAGKSEQEVYEHEIAMEREEMRTSPQTEQDELALIYEAKGLPAEVARQVAAQLMADPEIALREMARGELGISEETGSPFKDGLLTGVSTALGAVIPVCPFFFSTGRAAIWTAFTIAMLSHFGVGAARSLFTGRGIFRSGIDMFLVGLGVAVASYFIGSFLMKGL